jgi:hypothetical protein
MSDNKIKKNWRYISLNSNITWNDIKHNLDENWYWDIISCHNNITWDIIKNNPDCKWDKYWLLYNQNITWDIINSNIDLNWNWDWVFDSILPEYKNKWIELHRLKIIKALQIQRHWRNFSFNPIYKLARKNIYNSINIE